MVQEVCLISWVKDSLKVYCCSSIETRIWVSVDIFVLMFQKGFLQMGALETSSKGEEKSESWELIRYAVLPQIGWARKTSNYLVNGPALRRGEGEIKSAGNSGGQLTPFAHMFSAGTNN